MKQLYIKVVVIFLFSLEYHSLNATGRDGGQITYKLIDSTKGRYRFQVELYRLCLGIGYGS